MFRLEVCPITIVLDPHDVVCYTSASAQPPYLLCRLLKHLKRWAVKRVRLRAGLPVALCRYLNLVIVEGESQKPGRVLLRWLEEESDGLFRMAPGVYEEKKAALMKVRTQWIPRQGGRDGGYKLLTLRSRILSTELVD